MSEQQGVSLSGLTTMRVGGPAERLVTVKTTDELVDAVHEVDDAEESLLILAGGSNLVIADEGFAGSVVRIATTGISVESADSDSGAVRVRVAAGEVWDDVVVQAVQQGWSGIEALSGIPGCAGATPIQNVGAYGQEVAQVISSVLVWDRREQRVHTFTNADCRFTYRHSLFKAEPRYVVLEVVLQLQASTLSRPVAYADLARALGVDAGERVPLEDARVAVLDQRRQRGMVLDPADRDTWSCGSFFTNPIMPAASYAALQERAQALLTSRQNPDKGPVRVPRFDTSDGQVKTVAAWLIDKAGYGKGYGMPGPAALSSKHVLAVTNRGSATTADIIALAREVREGVQDAFGVNLVHEPVLVGTSL
ncbi:MAG: UDP-N-acetylmuramate dehydrogenase [Actinomycetota bacterium]|jgi:UDP-N-acetylmuramate dehydrogenase|nr:UDP-N-acetylmuramate dehydrogenase [Actinomycetota bacterium]